MKITSENALEYVIDQADLRLAGKDSDIFEFKKKAATARACAERGDAKGILETLAGYSGDDISKLREALHNLIAESAAHSSAGSEIDVPDENCTSQPVRLMPHPLAEIFPMASEGEITEMAADIARRGLATPIIMLDELILDGRNRYDACLRAGVEPRFCEYEGSDPLGDIISFNLHRRHLTPSQLAMVALKLKPLLEAQAKERQTGSRIKNGKVPARANLPAPGKGKAVDQAAKAVGVSGRLVQDAQVVANADPALAGQVAAGEMSVCAATRKLKSSSHSARAAEDFHEVPPGGDPDIAPDEEPAAAAPPSLDSPAGILFATIMAIPGANVGISTHHPGMILLKGLPVAVVDQFVTLVLTHGDRARLTRNQNIPKPLLS
jgi:hypothetical protein